MIIKILGTGCPKCKLLEQAARDAVAQLGITAEVIKVQNMEDIMAYDIMATPALVVDEKVIMTGRVPNVEELVKLLPNLSHVKVEKSDCDSGSSCGCGGTC